MSSTNNWDPDVSLTLLHEGGQKEGVVSLECVTLEGLVVLRLDCDQVVQHVLSDNTQLIELYFNESAEGDVAAFHYRWKSDLLERYGVSVSHAIPDMSQCSPDWPIALVDLHLGYRRSAAPASEFIRIAGVLNLFVVEACEEYIVLRSSAAFHEQVSSFSEYHDWKAEVVVHRNSWKMKNLLGLVGLARCSVQPSTEFGVVYPDEE